MHAMTLHAQADLWQHGAATYAALFMEGDMRSPDNEVDRTDVLLYAVLNRGLRLATDLPRLALEPRPGWAVRLNPAGTVTLTWPHVQPLLLDTPLHLPDSWPQAAGVAIAGDSAAGQDHPRQGSRGGARASWRISRFNAPPLPPNRSLCVIGGAELGDKEVATEISPTEQIDLPHPRSEGPPP